MLAKTGVPNFITLLRIGLIPFFIACFYLPFKYAHIFTAILFALASVTDWLDGFLARKLGQVSPFGAFLDPVADKLLVASSLLMLVSSPDLAIITVPSIVIVGREIVISALREWMAEVGQRASVAVGVLGKVKTSMQMAAIIILLAFHSYGGFMTWLGIALLYLAAIMTVWSMIIYLRVAWPQLIKN